VAVNIMLGEKSGLRNCQEGRSSRLSARFHADKARRSAVEESRGGGGTSVPSPAYAVGYSSFPVRCFRLCCPSTPLRELAFAERSRSAKCDILSRTGHWSLFGTIIYFPSGRISFTGEGWLAGCRKRLRRGQTRSGRRASISTRRPQTSSWGAWHAPLHL
jgi:hypothetical protein